MFKMFFLTVLFLFQSCAISKDYSINRHAFKPSAEHEKNWSLMQGTWYGEERTVDGFKRIQTTVLNANGEVETTLQFYKDDALSHEHISYGKWGVANSIYFTTLEATWNGTYRMEYEVTDSRRFFAYRIVSINNNVWEYVSERSGDTFIVKRKM